MDFDIYSELGRVYCVCHKVVLEKLVGDALILSMIRCGIADENSFMSSSRIIPPVQIVHWRVRVSESLYESRQW